MSHIFSFDVFILMYWFINLLIVSCSGALVKCLDCNCIAYPAIPWTAAADEGVKHVKSAGCRSVPLVGNNYSLLYYPEWALMSLWHITAGEDSWTFNGVGLLSFVSERLTCCCLLSGGTFHEHSYVRRPRGTHSRLRLRPQQPRWV